MSELKDYLFIFTLMIMAGLNIWTMMMPLETILLKVVAVCALLGCSIATLYSASNYSKRGFKFYKVFMFVGAMVFALSAVSNMMSLNLLANYSLMIIANSVLGFVACACLLVLCFSENLGKEKSNIFVKTALVISFILLGLSLVLSFVARNSGYVASAGVIRNLSKIVLVFTAKEMVDAKYLDKKARGSK